MKNKRYMKNLFEFLKSIQDLSCRTDFIFLELLKAFKHGEDREKIFIGLNEEINTYAIWGNFSAPREYKYMGYGAESMVRKEEIKAKEKEEYLDLFRELFNLQINGIKLCCQILNEIIKEEYESKQLSGYYCQISLPYFIILKKQKGINNHTFYEFLYETLNKRVITLMNFKIIYHLSKNVLGVKMLPIASYHNKLIKESNEIKKQLDKLIISKSPGYLEAKNKGYYKINPLDKNIGTMEGLIKLLNEKEFNFIYFKPCERQGCNNVILKYKFLSNKKKRGPYDKYCNDCKQKQRRELTRIRVKRYREKIKMAA